MSIGLKIWTLQLVEVIFKILLGKTFWPSIMITRLDEMWPLEHTQGFPKIWPSHLVFLPNMARFQICPRFQYGKNFDQVNHEYRTENVASRVYTRFFL